MEEGAGVVVCGLYVESVRGLWGERHSCRPTVDPVLGNRISQVRVRREGAEEQKAMTPEVKEQTSQRGTSSNAETHWGTGIRLRK